MMMAMMIMMMMDDWCCESFSGDIDRFQLGMFQVQEMFSSHGGLLTNAMYHHGKTLKSN